MPVLCSWFYFFCLSPPSALFCRQYFLGVHVSWLLVDVSSGRRWWKFREWQIGRRETWRGWLACSLRGLRHWLYLSFICSPWQTSPSLFLEAVLPWALSLPFLLFPLRGLQLPVPAKFWVAHHLFRSYTHICVTGPHSKFFLFQLSSFPHGRPS